jgi:DNA-binding response OmpR family regulator
VPAAAVSFHTLIVEDDPSASDALGEVLDRAGIESVLATSVSQGLLAIEQDWPPAVVLDLGLPDADGTVLLRRLKRDARRTRVAVVTGVSDLSRFVELRHFQPDVLLYKPIDVEKLLRWLRWTRSEYERAVEAGDDAAWSAPSTDKPEQAAGDIAAPRAEVLARRQFPRFLVAGARRVQIRAAGDATMPSDETPARDARILDCSEQGVAIAYGEPMSPGEWFSLTADTPEGAFTAVYAARHCSPLPDSTHRIGAELLGVLAGPEDEPRAMLEALLRPGGA